MFKICVVKTYKSMSFCVAVVAFWVAQQRANKISNIVSNNTRVHPVRHRETLRIRPKILKVYNGYLCTINLVLILVCSNKCLLALPIQLPFLYKQTEASAQSNQSQGNAALAVQAYKMNKKVS